MEVKKCTRCGGFIISSDNICTNCIKKDSADIQKLRSFLLNNDSNYSINELSINTGISEQNLNRFMNDTNFSSYLKNEDAGLNNISIYF